MADDWTPAGYGKRFGAEQYDELRSVVADIGAHGPFDANAVLGAWMDRRIAAAGGNPLAVTVNAGDLATMLYDLEELEVIRRVKTAKGAPPRWQLV